MSKSRPFWYWVFLIFDLLRIVHTLYKESDVCLLNVQITQYPVVITAEFGDSVILSFHLRRKLSRNSETPITGLPADLKSQGNLIFFQGQGIVREF